MVFLKMPSMNHNTLSFIPKSQQHTLFLNPKSKEQIFSLNPKSQQLPCMAQSKISNLRFQNEFVKDYSSLSLSLNIKETIEFWMFRSMAQSKIFNLRFWNYMWRMIPIFVSLCQSIKETIGFWTFGSKRRRMKGREGDGKKE